jgi:dsDNA-specific endonuclease/ATPase MutS2
MGDSREPDDGGNGEDAIALDIGPELDLHTFRPDEVAELVPDYLDECVRLGLRQVRIVHGKGTGTLRRIVHAALDRHPAVDAYDLGGPGAGGWGATVVVLRARR